MKDQKSDTLFRKILKRYALIPKQLRSRKTSERSKAQRLITFSLLLPIMLYCAGYIAVWQINKAKIERNNAAYSELYAESMATETPSATQDPITATPEITTEPTIVPTATTESTNTPEPTAAPTDTILPTEIPESPVEIQAMDIAVDEALIPNGTPDADTLVFSIATPPPVQESFNELLSVNEETVGFLKVGSYISLPVVQRKNDNEYYLSHSFEGESSNAGTLFLDGANLLVPEDENLIIYGHNMKNGTMFHPLIAYSELDGFRRMGLVQFDTIYENKKYVPFAAFSVTTEVGGSQYLDIRQFIFDEQSFELFVLKMQKYSLFDVPIDVEYGDNILLLVTCEYVYDNGRFVIALREIRSDESEDALCELLMQSEEN